MKNLSTLKEKALHNFGPHNIKDLHRTCSGKSGIYCLVNNINGNYYIGSRIDLNNRLRDYQQPGYLRDKGDLTIIRAIKKYGIENFSMLVIEFTTVEQNILDVEQVWLDNFNPPYNMLKKAGSSLGYIHTEERKIKISKTKLGKKKSRAEREQISLRQVGTNNNFYGKKHTEKIKALIRRYALNRDIDPNPGFKVVVYNRLDDTTQVYKSYRERARRLKTSHGTISKYVDTNKYFQDKYIITIMNI